MKTQLFLFLICTMFLTSCGSSKPINDFYRKHKDTEGVKSFSMPGWLVWVGTGMAYHSVYDAETRLGLKLAKKVKHLQFMQSEAETGIPRAEIQALINDLREKSFEDLLYVRDGQSHVSIMIRDTEEKLKNIFILVDEPDEFTLFSMKSSLKYEDLSKLISHYINDFNGEKKKPEPNKPQA